MAEINGNYTSGDVLSDEVICEGESCGHCSFKLSEKGCNSILKFCSKCAQELSNTISGNLCALLALITTDIVQ